MAVCSWDWMSHWQVPIWEQIGSIFSYKVEQNTHGIILCRSSDIWLWGLMIIRLSVKADPGEERNWGVGEERGCNCCQILSDFSQDMRHHCEVGKRHFDQTPTVRHRLSQTPQEMLQPQEMFQPQEMLTVQP